MAITARLLTWKALLESTVMFWLYIVDYTTKKPKSSGLTQPRPQAVNPERGALSPERAKSG